MRHHLCPALVIALALGALPTLSLAQTATAPLSSRDEEIRRLMESSSNAMVPSAARTADAVLDAELKFAERPDTALRVASYKRNLYEALMKKGFSAEQAMQIVLHTPLPSSTAR
jgi:hypothetical protein